MPKKKGLLTLLICGALGLALHIVFKDQAFRWSALKLSLSRSQAIKNARELLKDEGFSLEGSKQSAAFWTYDTPVIYFEKKIGTEATNRLLSSQRLPVWGWEARFFWPNEREEYEVWWSPKGEFVGFEHDILRESALPSLDEAAAKKLAEDFLRVHIGDELSHYKLIEHSLDQKPNRLDHYLRWKIDQSPLESRQFLRATVAGNQLSSVRREIEIPEGFIRSEEEIGSRRNLLSAVFDKIDFCLTAAMFIFMLTAWRRRWLRWKAALIFALAVFAVDTIDLFNDLPMTWHHYSTDQTIAAFWLSYGTTFLSMIMSTAWLMLPFASSDATGRLLPGARYSLGEITHRSFFRTESFFDATLAGFGAAGIQLGFVVVFYLLGQSFFGIYTPSEVPYDNLLTTAFPWIVPLVTGLSPALIEETTYRLFAIPLLLRFTKRRWLALLIPAVLWGFLHTGYYVEPIYARGLELTLVGLLLGWVFLRYGIWATIVSHYIYNATISSSLLLSSDNLYLQLSAYAVIGIVLVPFFFALRAFFKKLRVRIEFEPLHWRQKRGIALPMIRERRNIPDPPPLNLRIPLLVTSSILLVLVFLPFHWQAEQPQLNRNQAISAAKTFLRSLGHDVRDFQSSGALGVSNTSDVSWDVATYVRRELGKKEADRYLAQFQARTPYWDVGFVSPQNPKECEAKIIDREHVLEFFCQESKLSQSPGLDDSTSRASALEFLSKQHLNVDKLEYAGILEEQHPHRRDIIHRWVDPEATVRDLRRYVTVGYIGDRLSSFRSYLKVPERFLKERNLETAWNVLHQIFQALVGLIAVFLVIRSFFDHHLLASLKNRFLLKLALAGGAIYMLDWMNGLPEMWASYDSSIALSVFYSRKVISVLGEATMAGAFTYLGVLLLTSIAPQVFPHAPTVQGLEVIVKRPPWKWRGSREGLIWAMGLVTLETALRVLFFWLKKESLSPLDPDYDAFSTFFPPLEILYPLWRDLLSWAIIGAVLASCRRYLKTWQLGLLMTVGLLAALGAPDQPWQDIAFYFSRWILVALVILRVIGFRLPFYFWYTLIRATIPFIPWLSASLPTFRLPSLFLVGMVAMLSLSVLYSGRIPDVNK